MKKLNLLISSAIITIFASSCSITQKSVSSETMKVIKTDIVTKPQIAEINIESRRIEGFAEVKKKDYMPNPREACTNLALNDATKKGNCDIVVQPKYEIEETGRFISVKVTGFAGTYKKFRELVDADTTAFKVYEKVAGITNVKMEGAKSNNIFKNTSGKKRGGTAILGLLALPLLLLLIL